MNGSLSVALLIVMSAALFMLPLIPALAELNRKSDAQPLSVIQQHAGEIRHFADRFRLYINELEPLLLQAVNTGTTLSGTLPDKTEYLVLGSGKEALRLPLRQSDETCPVLLATGIDLSLPPDTAFSKDVYVAGRFRGGTKNRYRAILGEKEVDLGAESHVMRWVHAVGNFSAGPACQLHGRVSSDTGIQLSGGDSTFQRLNAPQIQFGNPPMSSDFADTAEPSDSWATPPRLLHDGNFEIPDGQTFRGNLVARGVLRIGRHAHILGDVKGDRGVVVDEGAILRGSLISSNTMRIGANCDIHGPVIAEKVLILEHGTRCGSAEKPTTVSAPWIQVEEGVVVFGTLWAREHGAVVAKV
jgi:hypothetical protein